MTKLPALVMSHDMHHVTQVKVYDLTAESHEPNDVLILGSDGLWDVMTNSQAQETVLQTLLQLDDSDQLR